MKSFLQILAFTVIFFTGYSQTITLQKISEDESIKAIQNIFVTPVSGISVQLHDGKLETTEDISFAPALVTLELREITIIAKKITIPATITNLVINGDVKLVCDELNFVNAASSIICRGAGSLSFSFKRITNSGGGNSRVIAPELSGIPPITINYIKIN